MAQYKIPKLARNKYNYIEGADGKHYMTVSQATQFTTGSGGGGGGGGGGVPSATVISAQSVVAQALYDKGIGPDNTILSYQDAQAYYVKQAYLTDNYVSKTEIANASYVTTTQLSNMTYVTQSELSACSYVTNTVMEETLKDYSKTEVQSETGSTKTVSQSDGIIVLESSSASTVTLPTTDIEDGKVIYIINKTGQSFTISTTGQIVNKEASDSSRQSQTVSENVIQLIYYSGEWFVI